MLASARYASKIIKASALIGDTRTLLTQWNLGRSLPENLARLHAENLLGKSSRSRLENVLPVFRQRYMADPAVLAGLVVLAHAGLPAPVLDTILLHLTLASDALLATAITIPGGTVYVLDILAQRASDPGCADCACMALDWRSARG